MKKALREHQLLVALMALLILTLVLGTWATYYEYVHNEQGNPEGHHAFFSWTFLAYWTMQLFMNFAPELMGLIVFILFAAWFRERFESAKKAQ